VNGRRQIVPQLNGHNGLHRDGLAELCQRALVGWRGLVYRQEVGHSWRTRLVAMAVLGACIAIWCAAAYLKPAVAGIGTHQQLGMAPCSLITMTGYPCPTCGMTTAFAWAIRGKFLASFAAQPVGFLLAILTAITAVQAVYVLSRGKMWTLNWYRTTPFRLAAFSVAVVLGGWIYKVIVHTGG
jgi:hypothetical protein